MKTHPSWEGSRGQNQTEKGEPNLATVVSEGEGSSHYEKPLAHTPEVIPCIFFSEKKLIWKDMYKQLCIYIQCIYINIQ